MSLRPAGLTLTWRPSFRWAGEKLLAGLLPVLGTALDALGPAGGPGFAGLCTEVVPGFGEFCPGLGGGFARLWPSRENCVSLFAHLRML